MNKRAHARATLSASRALPKTLPLTGTVMERHRFSTQTFFPLDVVRYVVVVAPPDTTGLPDMRLARAMIVPGDTAITYAADAWHHPMIVSTVPVVSRFSCGEMERLLIWRQYRFKFLLKSLRSKEVRSLKHQRDAHPDPCLPTQRTLKDHIDRVMADLVKSASHVRLWM